MNRDYILGGWKFKMHRINAHSLVKVEYFPLVKDDLGIDAVRLMNERFKGYGYVELDISI